MDDGGAGRERSQYYYSCSALFLVLFAPNVQIQPYRWSSCREEAILWGEVPLAASSIQQVSQVSLLQVR